MGMPEIVRRWTAAQVRALPEDGRRHEVIAGNLLMTPSPGRAHQRAVGGLLTALSGYLEPVSDLEVLASPADVELDGETLVQPDLFVTRIARDQPDDWEHLDLRLAIEVLSPATARYDRLTKRLLYQRQGVEYWIVDLDARVLERWRPEDERPEILVEKLTWLPEGMESALVLDLERYFAGVLGG